MRHIFHMLHQNADHTLCVGEVIRVCDIHILAVTVTFAAVLGDCQDVRIFFYQPCRYGIGRCSDDHGNMVACGSI